MRNLTLFIASFFLFSCVNENELLDVFPTQLLNANSSKVWILNESNDPNIEEVPEMKAYRTCFIFYKNSSFREQRLIYLGSEKGAVGKYSIKEDGNGNYIFTLYYPKSNKKNIEFKVLNITHTQLELQRKSKKNEESIWELNTLDPPLY